MKVYALLSELTYRGGSHRSSSDALPLRGETALPGALLLAHHAQPGYFNIVDAEAIDYVHKRFAAEKGLTSKALHQRCSKPEHIKAPLEALNILYVVTATPQAQVDSRFHDRELHSNLKA